MHIVSSLRTLGRSGNTHLKEPEPHKTPNSFLCWKGWRCRGFLFGLGPCFSLRSFPHSLRTSRGKTRHATTLALRWGPRRHVRAAWLGVSGRRHDARAGGHRADAMSSGRSEFPESGRTLSSQTKAVVFSLERCLLFFFLEVTSIDLDVLGVLRFRSCEQGQPSGPSAILAESQLSQVTLDGWTLAFFLSACLRDRDQPTVKAPKKIHPCILKGRHVDNTFSVHLSSSFSCSLAASLCRLSSLVATCGDLF